MNTALPLEKVINYVMLAVRVKYSIFKYFSQFTHVYTEMSMRKNYCLRFGKEEEIVMRFDILKGLFSDHRRNEALHFKIDFQLKKLIGLRF